MDVLEVDALSEEDLDTFRRALFENQVVVIKNQKGIAPETLPKLTKVFDPTATDIHSAGEKAVSDPRNILSAYKAGRIPRAPQVGIIGSGKFKNYEGVEELEVIHLVCLEPFFDQLINQISKTVSHWRSELTNPARIILCSMRSLCRTRS